MNLNKKPDLKILNFALKKINTILKKNDILIFESTYYPGATEELVKKTLKDHSMILILVIPLKE